VAERRLRALLQRAGFPEGRWQEQHRFADRTLGTTTPDVTYDAPDDPDCKIYIYLDGLSAHIHGNAETRHQDMQIRQELMAAGNDVLMITAHDLGDQQIMTRHFKRLARMLEGKQAVARIVEGVDTWFGATDSGSTDDDADD